MKICFKCQTEKPLSEFYAHSKMSDKRINKCKQCARKDAANNLARRMLDPQFRIKEAARHRKKTADRAARGLSAIVPKEKDAEYKRKWQSANLEKRKAHQAIRAAIETGKLTRIPCVKCGEMNSESHHEDYSKPLDVIWLCRKHHAERHVEINDGKRLIQTPMQTT